LIINSISYLLKYYPLLTSILHIKLFNLSSYNIADSIENTEEEQTIGMDSEMDSEMEPHTPSLLIISNEHSVKTAIETPFNFEDNNDYE
jgi:hypothetical protein